jgi:hypothetical protein
MKNVKSRQTRSVGRPLIGMRSLVVIPTQNGPIYGHGNNKNIRKRELSVVL